jgi:thioredoxin-related protein
MKKISFALCVSILLFAAAAFCQDYEAALKTAKRENKPVLLYFFSTSCYYCRIMDRSTLSDKEVDGILKKDFVYLRIDVDKSRDMGDLYRITGTPSSWFLESSGKRIGEIPGYVKAKEYKHILEYVKGKHYREMDLQAYIKKASAGR